MQPNKISILSTRPIDNSLIEEAKRLNIETDVLSFIETEPVQSIYVQQEIEQALLLTTNVVFTSMNAVDAVVNYKEEVQPNWKIYCIGSTTNKLVQNYFGEELIAGTASSAAELAELIVEENDTSEVIFFCGDQRRDELPDILRNNDIEVNEIVVYETVAVPHKVEKQYHGILFFSPSAVESFFSNNKVKESTVLFAIGNTTANAIKKYSNNKIIISEEPGKDSLFQKMMEYFS
jgi:uroporphyrinogen-III synthase